MGVVDAQFAQVAVLVAGQWRLERGSGSWNWADNWSSSWNWADNWSGSGRRGHGGWFRKPGCVDLLHFREDFIELLHVDSVLLLHGLPS